MKLHDASADYLNFLRHEQRATASTCRTYQSGLNAFLRWMEENGNADPTTFDFNLPTLRRYLYFHSERGLRPRTLRGRFHPLKALAAFLLANGGLKDDPTKALILPKKDPAQRLTVSEVEVRALLDACERLSVLRRMALCRAVLSVLIFSGLRRQELLDLSVSDYQTGEGALHVRHGKGNKERTVYLPDIAKQALAEWLLVREKDCQEDFLFMLDRRRRVGQEALRALVEEVKAIAGLRGAANIKPHSLRHFYASHLLQNGGDLESIRQLLGHADLRTTAIYIHADKARLKEVGQLAALSAITASSPKEKEDSKVIHLPQREEQRERLRRRIAR